MTGDLLVSYFGTWQGQTQMNEFSWRTDCTKGALLQREQFSDLTVIRSDEREPHPVPLPEQERLVDDTRLMLTMAEQLPRRCCGARAVRHRSHQDLRPRRRLRSVECQRTAGCHGGVL